MRSSLLLALPLAVAAALPAFAQQVSTTTTGYDSWVMSCNSQTGKDKKAVKSCEIRSTLMVRDQQTNQQGVAAVVAVGRLAFDKPEMRVVVQLPLNAVLNIPVRITSKDGRTAIELPFAACQPPVCSAGLTINDTQLSAFKKIGGSFHVSYRNQLGQDLKIEGSTKGLDHALEALMREK